MKKFNFIYQLNAKNNLRITVILSFLFFFPFSSFSQNKAIDISSTGICTFGYNVSVLGSLSVSGNILTDNLTISCTGGHPLIYPKVTNQGYLGTLNNQFKEIRGQTHYATEYVSVSDKRMKENFRKIQTPLGKILKMDGLEYDFISNEKETFSNESEKSASLKHEKNKLGFIAQDLEKIAPEAVFYAEQEDRYYINYDAIIPIIVEAMKEQQIRIDNLESEINNLKSSQKNNDASFEKDKVQSATLGQNIPNPFSETTHIAISLPQSVGKATLYVYNMQGVQIKSFTLNERGETSITIEGNSLKAGMYLYTLIADSKEVDTKKMILTK
jgi:hypothetical protein